MHQYNWSIDYCMKLTKSQIALFINKINKRREHDIEFQKALHGIKPKNRGFDLSNAVPIEDIIDGSNAGIKM